MNVASDVVQLGQPPNGTGGKNPGIEKGGQKISETNRDRPSAGLTLILQIRKEWPSPRQHDTPWKFNIEPENI